MFYRTSTNCFICSPVPRILVAIVLQSLCLRLILNTWLHVSAEHISWKWEIMLFSLCHQWQRLCKLCWQPQLHCSQREGHAGHNPETHRLPRWPWSSVDCHINTRAKNPDLFASPKLYWLCWLESREGAKRGFSTFHGKLSSTLSDFSQERDLLSKKVLISHRCFSQ